jgi:hypothetical protein
MSNFFGKTKPVGQALITTQGWSTWVVPNGVYSISVVAVQAGGDTSGYGTQIHTPNGGHVCRALNGGRIGDGGGDGGVGGGMQGQSYSDGHGSWWSATGGGGGGGAGGYGHDGGRGASVEYDSSSGTNISIAQKGSESGGAGGRGGMKTVSSYTSQNLTGAGGGGGVGVHGAILSALELDPAEGGSGGFPGGTTNPNVGGAGGNYGGGCGATAALNTVNYTGHTGGALSYKNNISVSPGQTISIYISAPSNNGQTWSGIGVIRIIWGEGRAFPSTNAHDMSSPTDVLGKSYRYWRIFTGGVDYQTRYISEIQMKDGAGNNLINSSTPITLLVQAGDQSLLKDNNLGPGTFVHQANASPYGARSRCWITIDLGQTRTPAQLLLAKPSANAAPSHIYLYGSPDNTNWYFVTQSINTTYNTGAFTPFYF